LIASDQYAAEARFTVRGGAAPKLDSLAALTGVPTVQIIQDTKIVLNFIQSRAIVEQLDHKLDLRGIFSRPGVARFCAFNPEKPIEKLVRYWKTMVGDLGTDAIWHRRAHSARVHSGRRDKNRQWDIFGKST